MINLEYHKGQPCVHIPLLCQEGFCDNCWIDQTLNDKKKTREVSPNAVQ